MIQHWIDVGENQVEDAAKWKEYWIYFTRQWMGKVPTWNIFAFTTNKKTLNNHTNNGLEKFNRQMNGAFPTSHPNIVVFVTGIGRISNDYVKRLDDIRCGHAEVPVRDECTIPTLPARYVQFKP